MQTFWHKQKTDAAEYADPYPSPPPSLAAAPSKLETITHKYTQIHSDPPHVLRESLSVSPQHSEATEDPRKEMF